MGVEFCYSCIFGHFPFEHLRPGMGVRFNEEMGEKGPQATSVQIVEIPESY